MFSQLFTQMAGTWLSVESVFFRNPDFWPKIHFLNATPFFSKDHRRSWTWAPHRHWTSPKISFRFPFRPFFVIFAKKKLTRPHYAVLSVTSLCLQRTCPSGLRAARAGLDKGWMVVFGNSFQEPPNYGDSCRWQKMMAGSESGGQKERVLRRGRWWPTWKSGWY